MTTESIAYRFRYAAEHVPEPRPEPFDVDEDGSGLLRAIKRRCEELGWMNERGKIAFEELLAAEVQAFPMVQEAHAFLMDAGFPNEDDSGWDDLPREYLEMMG